MADNQEEKIKALFWAKGLKIEDVADKLGITKPTLYSQMRKRPLDLNFVNKVKEIFNIDINEGKIIEVDKDAEIARLNAKIMDLYEAKDKDAKEWYAKWKEAVDSAKKIDPEKIDSLISKMEELLKKVDKKTGTRD